MATLYLAEDLKHRRKVAVKVLHAELSAVLGPERFLKEIELTASLQHPHILPLFDSGSAEGLLYYVMPFVEGESLRDRLTRERQLPIGDAVRIANEVADALAYAHDRGVIHRDIKPENILLQNGHALVADFRIALAVEQAGGQRMTQTGLSLGTPQYMAPEQAMGERHIDARADIYALAAVTYEMLAGEPPFTGPTAQAIVAKVITEEPKALTTQRRNVPPHVESAVRTALEKLPADRFASASEFAAALRGELGGSPNRLRRGWTTARPMRAAAVGAVVLAVGVATGWLARRAPVTPAFPVRFILSMDSSHTLEQEFTSPLNLRGTEWGGQPAYSPDGRWLAFDGPNGILRMPVGGGVPQVVAPLKRSFTVRGMAWTPHGDLVYAAYGALYVVSAPGSTPVRLTHPDSLAREQHVSPAVSPDGRIVLFTSRLASAAGLSVRLGVLDLRTRSVRYLDTPALAPAFLARDTIVCGLADGRLIQQSLVGSPPLLGKDSKLVAEHVRVIDGTFAQFAASTAGVLMFRPGVDSLSAVVRVDRRGAEQVLFTTVGGQNLRMSPDGDHLAYVRLSSRPDFLNELWVYSLSTHTTSPATRAFADINDPAWSPDGRLLAFAAGSQAQWRVAVMPTDGSAPPRVLTPPGNYFQPTFTPDGRRLVLLSIHSSFSDADLLSVAITGGTGLDTVLATPFDEAAPAVSPDGRWLAYHSNESGQYEAYVRPFPGPGNRTVVSENGGREPSWSRDGREIFYRVGTQLVAVPVTSREPLTLGERRVLFSGPYNLGLGNREYDVAPDAEHFIFARSATRPYLVVQMNGAGRR